MNVGLKLTWMIYFWLFLSTVEALTPADTDKYCFVATTSNVPRVLIKKDYATTRTGCNVACAEITECEACVHNSNTRACNLLGALGPANGCTSTYTAYEKRTTGCTAIPPPSTTVVGYTAGDGYATGPCSLPANLVGAAATGRKQPCGTLSVGQRRVVFDAVLHNSARMVLENWKEAIIDWDDFLNSWFFNFGTEVLYFKTGACVRPPATSLTGCECARLPTESPIAGYGATGADAVMGTAPICANIVQLHYRRPIGTGGIISEVMNATDRAVYCAMGVWMNIIDQTNNYNEYTVSAASCVKAV